MKEVTSFITKYWKHPIALVIYGLIIIYIIYRLGKSSGTVKPNTVPSDKNWGKDLTNIESTNIRRIVQRLYRDMDNNWVSMGIADRDTEVYKQLMNLSNTEFTGVYNDFNDLYFDKGEGTLADWIYDESFTFTWGASGDLRETLIERFEKLNLKREGE